MNRKNETLRIMILISIIALCFVQIVKLQHASHKCDNVETIKTIIIRDTIRDTIPTFINRYVVRTDTVTAFAHLNDTVYQRGRDTVEVYIPIPVERRTYQTDYYKAIIEGYNPELIYIETYKQTEIQRVRDKRPKWGIGLQVGYGTDFTHFTPYIGIGLTYSIKQF